MLSILKSADRGRSRSDWLDSAHSFSFGGYRDPERRGFRALRVINEDWISPASGFGPHPHAEMEILSFVVSGALAHRDSTGREGVIRAGEVQAMSAGRGIVHSEHNPSAEDPTHLLQVWLEPNRRGLAPHHRQRVLEGADAGLVLAAGPLGSGAALEIHADARVHAGSLAPGQRFAPALEGHHAWLQLVRGAVALGDARLEAGDGAAASELPEFELRALEASELLVFDLD